jgi:ketosteroid isomerase-like protein
MPLLETLRSEYEAMSRKDWDALFREADPSFELKTPDRHLGLSGSFRGRDSARRVFKEFFGPFETVSVEPEAFFEGNDRIVVFFLQRSKPRGSTGFVEARAAHLWTIGAGRAVRLEIFPRREGALEAAGLSEQGARKDR